MSTPYVVQPGDWGQKIAQQHGFAGWREIYSHPDNLPLRRVRPNPEKIFPGDVVMIPARPTAPDDEKKRDASPDSPARPDDAAPELPDAAPDGDGAAQPAEPPAAGKLIIAREGDTLCSVAVTEGFADCAPLRAMPQNKFFLRRPLKAGDCVAIPAKTEGAGTGQTEMKHTFQRRGKPLATIRFIHGTMFEAKEDPSLDHIDISNHQTDLAGADRTQAFATAAKRTYDADADADDDTFRLEVTDNRTHESELKVELDALKPVYRANGSVLKHEYFPGTRTAAGSEAGKRSLDTVAARLPRTNRFRTCYLRLVTDEWDKGIKDAAGRKDQTLLVSDMCDAADAEPDAAKAAALRQIEILDQRVRARYKLKGCPARSPQMQCQVTAEVPVGHDKKRVKCTIHVLRSGRDGAGVVTADQARNWALKYVRRMYAQANLSLDLFDPQVRLVQPPRNLIGVGVRTGQAAKGGGTIKVRVTVDGKAGGVAEIRTVAFETPRETADRLTIALGGVLPAGVRASSTDNAQRAGHPFASADVIIGDPLKHDIEISIVDGKDGDSKQRITIGAIRGTTIADFTGADASVGTDDERVLLRNYDTGSDRIDVFVVGAFANGGVYGEAFPPNKHVAREERRPKEAIANSVLVRTSPILTDTVQINLAHEMAHVLMDVGHTADTTQLIAGGPSVAIWNQQQVVAGPKRIADPAAGAPQVAFDAGVATGNPAQLIRNRNDSLITRWQGSF